MEHISSIRLPFGEPTRLPGDYIGGDGLLYCGNCHTAKQKDIFLWGMDESHRVPGLCECEEEQQRAKEQEELKRLRELGFKNHIENLRRRGLPDTAYRNWTFANDDAADTKISKACRKYVEDWETSKRNNTWLLFFGGVGVGKTYYAVCIANALIDRDVAVLVTSFPRILSKLQSAGFSEDREAIFEDILSYPLVVIDDLGAERETDYAVEQVYRIIDERYSSGKPMIITTNLTLSEMKSPEKVSQLRIYDRILERSVRIRMEGQSRRIDFARENHDAEARRLGLI